MYKVALFKSWRHPRKGPVPLFYSVDSDIRIWRCRTWICIFFGRLFLRDNKHENLVYAANLMAF